MLQHPWLNTIPFSILKQEQLSTILDHCTIVFPSPMPAGIENNQKESDVLRCFGALNKKLEGFSVLFCLVSIKNNSSYKEWNVKSWGNVSQHITMGEFGENHLFSHKSNSRASIVHLLVSLKHHFKNCYVYSCDRKDGIQHLSVIKL